MASDTNDDVVYNDMLQTIRTNVLLLVSDIKRNSHGGPIEIGTIEDIIGYVNTINSAKTILDYYTTPRAKLSLSYLIQKEL